jgi:hypothetical protein
LPLWAANINLFLLQAFYALLYWQLYGLLFCPHHLDLQAMEVERHPLLDLQ